MKRIAKSATCYAITTLVLALPLIAYLWRMW